MLDLKHITLLRATPVLSDISISFLPGRIYGIIGRSGAGKTSLLKIAAGLLDRNEGEVIYKEKILPGPSVKLIPGHEDIQLVNQDFALELYHTVRENVREKVLSRTKATQEDLVTSFLDLLELNELQNQKAIELSGGEQQRLALARALASEPDILLLDEPFVHLDQRLRWKIQEYLKELNRVRNTTIVLVSHDGAELMGFVEEIIHLKDANIVRRDSTESIYFNPTDKEQAELLGPINHVEINGENVLFRPNEFELNVEGQLALSKKTAVNTGLYWMHFYETGKGESVDLVEKFELPEQIRINIRKYGVERS